MLDPQDKPVWGARAIGEVINAGPRRTFDLLERGLLPAKKVGGRWVSTPRQLLDHLLGDEKAA